MPGLNTALLIGRDALQTRQQQMNLVGHNLSNADRVGYHRQRLVVKNNHPLDTPTGAFGAGSHVDGVVRSFHQGIESNLRQAVQQDSAQQAYADSINLLEGVMAPQGESELAGAMSAFAAAWQDLGGRPEDSNPRAIVVERAEDLATQVNANLDRVAALAASLADGSGNGAIPARVSELNALAARIATLNNSIGAIENRVFNPQPANDLRDERDALVMDMSRLVDATVTEQADSSYTVTVGGATLVSGNTTDTLTVALELGQPVLRLASSTAVVAVGAGEIDGFVRAHGYMQQVLTDVLNFGQAVSDTVNTAHTAGFDLQGAAGGNFFAVAADGRLSVLINSPNDIAASNSAVAIGNGDNARDVWTALNTDQVVLGNDSLLNRADRMVDAVALETSQALGMAESTAASAAMFREAVNSFSAVNADEEMISMLEVQRAYQAVARFVSAVDQMLGEALSRL